MSRSKSVNKAVKQLARGKKSRSLSGGSYWSMAAGLAGLAITAYLVFSVLGGKRGVTSKARALLDWESEGGSLADANLAEGGAGKRNHRGDNEVQTH